jgi:hypothetical protein
MTGSGRLFLGYNDRRTAFSDNSGAFSVTITAECAALGPAPTGPRIAFFGSAGSYDEDSLMAFLHAYPAEVTRDEANASRVTAAALAAYDVVVLDALARSFDADEAATFAAWIRRGGAVLSLTGFVKDDSTWQKPNSLLADLPVQYTAPFIPGATDHGDSCPGGVTEFTASPLTAGLRTLPFCGGYGVSVGDGAITIATIQGAAVAGASAYGSGRVYLWGDEWVEYSSTWPSSDVQTFWQNAIDWLRHRS